MAIYQLGDEHIPRIHESAWVAESAQVMGRVALAAEMFDVNRLERMVLAAAAPAPMTTTATAPKNASPARHLRPASAFALPLPFNTPTNTDGGSL